MQQQQQPHKGGAHARGGVQSTIFIQRVVIAVLAVVVVGGAVGVFGYSRGWFGGSANAPAPNVDPSAQSYSGAVGNTPKANPQADSIAIPGYPKIYAAAGQTAMDVVLGNPEGNPCYFVYELVLEDGDEVLYTSGQIPPGEAVPSITLSRALDAGEYPAVLKISTYHVETQAPMNGANVKTTLVVQ